MLLFVVVSYGFILVVKVLLFWVKNDLIVLFFLSNICVVVVVLVEMLILLLGLVLVFSVCNNCRVLIIVGLNGLFVWNSVSGVNKLDVGMVGNVKLLIENVIWLLWK